MRYEITKKQNNARIQKKCKNVDKQRKKIVKQYVIVCLDYFYNLIV